jgi:hypothetical protein
VPQRIEELPLSRYEEPRRGPSRSEANGGVDESLGALHTGEPTDEGDDWNLAWQREAVPGVVPAWY